MNVEHPEKIFWSRHCTCIWWLRIFCDDLCSSPSPSIYSPSPLESRKPLDPLVMAD